MGAILLLLVVEPPPLEFPNVLPSRISSLSALEWSSAACSTVIGGIDNLREYVSIGIESSD